MRDELMNALKEAMKARDTRRISTIRMVQAAIKDLDIASRTKADSTVTDGDIASLLSKLVKQREESLGIYEKAGRDDLAMVEREEIAILGEFLPKGLSEAEIEAAIIDAINKTGAAGAKDMGKVVASLKAEFPGRIDFGKASAKIRTALGA